MCVVSLHPAPLAEHGKANVGPRSIEDLPAGSEGTVPVSLSQRPRPRGVWRQVSTHGATLCNRDAAVPSSASAPLLLQVFAQVLKF